jgi:hypothetical protein
MPGFRGIGSSHKMVMGEKLKIRVCLWFFILLLFHSDGAYGWTKEGHIFINRVAAQKIPVSMPLFLRLAVAQISYLGPEPDRWRDQIEWPLKASQEPDHFIKLEHVSWLNLLPGDRYEFYRKLYEKPALTKDNPDDYLPENVGLQPYIVAEIYGRLETAFREYRKRRAAHESTASVQPLIIFYAGWLGHYVGDGCQPLHTTVQIYGWTGPNPHGYTTEHGIHALFESTYVAANIQPADFEAQVHAPRKMADPFVEYIEYLKHSNQLVEQVYILQKAGGFTRQGSREAFEFTTERLGAGSQMLLNLWYTAWITSTVTT